MKENNLPEDTIVKKRLTRKTLLAAIFTLIIVVSNVAGCSSETDDSRKASLTNAVTYKATITNKSVEPEKTEESSIVGSINSDVIHHSSCSHAKRIKTTNRVYYKSLEAAEADGRRPCKTCGNKLK